MTTEDVTALPAAASRVRPRTGPGRTQTVIVMAVTVVVIGALAWFVTDGFNDGVTSIELTGDLAPEPPAVGKPPTGFTGVGYDGAPISLSDYAGMPVWLNFGASWCRDCRTEAADLEATYENFRARGLVVLGVFINEPASDIEAYAQRAGLTFPIVVDGSTAIAAAYRILGIPTHVFIGADGLIAEIRIGSMSGGDMEQAVSRILP